MTAPADALDVAVIGMAGRFPGAKDVDELWQNVRGKVESIRSLTEEECIAAGAAPEQLRDPSFVRAVSEADGIEELDAAFFDIPPREAELMDPQHRMFLELAWTALEHAGYSPRAFPGRIGVFGGAPLSTYLLFHVAANPHASATLDPLQVNLANGADFFATRVSYKLDLRGPSHTVLSACSTSLVAVHVACRSLLDGECDIALAGGVSINVGQRHGYVHVKGGMASPDGRCRAFDAGAQGTIFASGGGIAVLKPLRAAIADGDFVHAVIRGSAVNNDGARKAGYTAPSADGQTKAIVEALAAAGVDAESIGYVEGHGTGTPMGDPIEVEALTRAFRRHTQRVRYCALGSIKTNLGHLDAAAGIAGLIKTVHALRHRELPPNLHFTRANPQMDLEASPFYVSSNLEPWAPDAAPRRAGVSSFGVGGSNAHVVLEEAPPRRPTSASRPWQILVVSARTDSALETATQGLLANLEAHPDTDLSDIAYTLQVGRQRFAHRRFVLCRDTADAVRALREPGRPRVRTSAADDRSDRAVAFLFPDLDAAHIGMAAAAYWHESPFRVDVDSCAELLRARANLDIRAVLYPPAERAGEASSQLLEPAVAHTALFVIEYALARLWMAWGLEPRAMLGYGVGELVCACLAGVFDLPAALSLAAARGRLTQSMPPGRMLVVPLAEDEVEPYLRREVTLAAVDAPARCVLAGPPHGIDDVEQALAADGIQTRRLPAQRAFHSPMMAAAAKEFAAAIRAARPRVPKRPFLSNVTGTWITSAEATSPDYWSDQLCKPVRFAEGLDALLAGERLALLEVGPGRSLSRLSQRHPSAAQQTIVPSLPGDVLPSRGAGPMHTATPEDAELPSALAQLWQAGVRVDWAAYYRDERRQRVPLPTYPFERKRFWIERPRPHPTPSLESAAEPAPVPAAPKHPRPASLRSPFAAPATALERLLTEQWEHALGIAPIGVLDNFFDLGGDSLIAVQLSARLERAMGREVPAVTFYEGLTVRSLARLLEAPEQAPAHEPRADTTTAQHRRRDGFARQRALRGSDHDE
ncbi:type I polyketide synthase [Pendulispora albinea]|uniref:Acyltransferase domain-containing protein n=1 Tax=Pendulispora albinea TaxID=2741071 RepID=A0ABZ2LSP3_9BACT